VGYRCAANAGPALAAVVTNLASKHFPELISRICFSLHFDQVSQQFTFASSIPHREYLELVAWLSVR
jgi:hypothetical protein